jgi:hypothetical protein
MYFHELKRLREANPKLSDAVGRLDEYLASLTGSARSNITVSTVSSAIGKPRDLVLGLLMASSELGLIKLRYRILCPDGHGVQVFDRLEDVPNTMYCGACDETRPVAPDDVEYFFGLTDKAASVRSA